jgi:hypothetical protein
MRKTFLLTACLCGLCFGHSGLFGDKTPECSELNKIDDYLDTKWKAEKDKKYIAAWWALFGRGASLVTKCQCAETIDCGHGPLCIAYKCPNNEESINIFTDTGHFLKKDNFYIKN